MTGGKVKLPIPNQLTSKGLTLDGLATFWSLLSNWVRQEPNYKNFLPGGEYEQWLPKKINSSRGIVVNYEQDPTDANVTEANRKAAEQAAARISSQLEDFLSTIASKCPEGMFRTIVNEATSMDWYFIYIDGSKIKVHNVLSNISMNCIWVGSQSPMTSYQIPIETQTIYIQNLNAPNIT